MSQDRSARWTVAYVLTIPIQLYLWGFTFATLWGWFLVSAIRVNPIGVWHATGIMLAVKFATIDWDKKVNTEDSERDFKTLLMAAFIVPTLFLGIGWFISYFM